MPRQSRKEQLTKYHEVKRLLAEDKLSKAQIARAARVSIPTVYNWNGRTEPPGEFGRYYPRKTSKRFWDRGNVFGFKSRAEVPADISKLRDELTAAFMRGNHDEYQAALLGLHKALADLAQQYQLPLAEAAE